jgi:FAD synthase
MNSNKEPYLIHEFENDFYGENLKLIILGHIRDNKNFENLDSLIKEIKNDIQIGISDLENDCYINYISDKFFKE